MILEIDKVAHVSKIAIVALALLASPAFAQDEPVTAPSGERINQLIIYGDDSCPQSTDEEIVVCAKLDEF